MQKPNTFAVGQNHGSVRNDLSADALADFVWNAWEGSLLRMKLEDLVEPLKACVQLMFDLFFNSATYRLDPPDLLVVGLSHSSLRRPVI
ncbi:TetR family transcriptional regulator C-terminal domain-containing protein [Paraburkholderia sediminicola]|uniref:TetR family transcriptional regulator C-terminal domain-containing protein n=1 Tax=Paraburkholderia rhynchosiae TaxID=487049 RepID=A0ACC7N8W0_9BURK